jgi:hypothetical protein
MKCSLAIISESCDQVQEQADDAALYEFLEEMEEDMDELYDILRGLQNKVGDRMSNNWRKSIYTCMERPAMPYSGGSPVVERWRRSCRRSSLQAYQRRPTSVKSQGVLWFGPVKGGYICLGYADRFES